VERQKAAFGLPRGAKVTAEPDLRDPSVTREELQDLLNYLNALPDDVRRTGAFTAYEQRVGELSRELVLSDLRLFTLQLPHQPPDELATISARDYERVYASLSKLTQEFERVAELSRKASRALHWGAVAASAGTVISALSATALVLPLSSVAVSLMGLYLVWLAGHTEKHERTAVRLSALREEVAHSFGPSGEVLRPSEYYPASARRIESLLDEIKATIGQDRAGV
jgi:hypothetical protein